MENFLKLKLPTTTTADNQLIRQQLLLLWAEPENLSGAPPSLCTAAPY